MRNSLIRVILLDRISREHSKGGVKGTRCELGGNAELPCVWNIKIFFASNEYRRAVRFIGVYPWRENLQLKGAVRPSHIVSLLVKGRLSRVYFHVAQTARYERRNSGVQI